MLISWDRTIDLLVISLSLSLISPTELLTWDSRKQVDVQKSFLYSELDIVICDKPE
jgi:hypothetical protein